MREAPPIPSWLREFRHSDYTNIYELFPDETRVFGTESLLGDWGAEILLLAKDYAPRQAIERRRDQGDERPFRHGWPDLDGPRGRGVRTNVNLVQELVPTLDGYRLLYGSALGGLLRNDGETSGPLPSYPEILEMYSARLLPWVAGSLPNLRAIACLGREALEAISLATGSDVPKISYGASATMILGSRPIQVFRMFHPSRAFRGGWEARKAEWEAMARALER